MKKIVVMSVISLTSLTAMAQNAAQMQLDAGKLDKAKTEIDKSIEDAKYSGKAKTWLMRGKIYEAIGNDRTGLYAKLDSTAALTAYESYKKALEVEPNGGKSNKDITDALASQNLYGALMNQGAAKYQNKKFTDAYKMMSLASTVTPKDTLAPLYAGISAQQGKQLDVAKQQFEKYAANGGKDPSVYYSLATLYRNDKETDKALATLDNAMKVLPGNKDLAAERINVLMSSGRMDEALNGMKQQVERDPNNIQNILNLGLLYDNSATKMSEDIRKATEDAGKGAGMTKKLASEKDALDAYNSEITRLNAAIKKTPAKAAELKRQLATAQKSKTDRQAALTQLEAQAKEEAGKGTDPAAAQKKADELKQKQTEQRTLAREYYAKALAIDPNNYDANFSMGVVYFNEAVEMKKQVDNMSMGDYQKTGKEVEGRVCGKFKQAQPYFLKAKAVKPDESDLNENLTNLTNVIKQFEEKKITCTETK